MTTRGILSGSVGRNGVNNADEVRMVQTLLNGWLSRNGHPAIKVDGSAGPETIGAIARFQAAVSKGTDARIDPGGPTLIALLCQHFQTISDQLMVQTYSYHGTPDASTPTPVSRTELEQVLKSYLQRLSHAASTSGTPSSRADPFVA